MTSIGILYSLLLVVKKLNEHKVILPQQAEIHDSVCFLVSQESMWRNFAQNFEDAWGGGINADITFCNGATGAVFLFTLAYEVFQKEEFLRAAERAAETCWKQGKKLFVGGREGGGDVLEAG
jgi:hypothetical protein